MRPTLYNPDFEHDGCGTGFVASLHGERSHRIVELGTRALVNLTHRGAVSTDTASGDGAGLTIQIPRELLESDATAFGLQASELGRLGLAMVFLPTDEVAASAAREVLADAARRSGVEVLGWRDVPVRPEVLGDLARASMPRIEQLLLARPESMDEPAFDRALYLARRRAETASRDADLDVYIVSMSARSVVYKGLLGAPQLEHFYPDLVDPRTVSSLVLFHQRFATNTLPNWKLAQPFRMIAHNGEINTLVGNRNWMAAREPELTSEVWGDDLQDLLPIIRPIGSDTASLDEALDLLTHSGRDLVEAMAVLVPEAWERMPGMRPKLRAFYQYHACLTEPWDGPAAVAFTDGTSVAASMDRNGLRPARYKITVDGLVIMASEVGVLEIPSSDVLESGRVGPGEMIAVDTARGRLSTDRDIKDAIASRHPYGAWLSENLRHLGRSTSSDGVVGDTAVDSGAQVMADLPTLQALHGYTREELSLVLGPMAQDGKEPIGSMGDDTALSVLSDSNRLLYTYFRQRFAQVTNPPIDPIRESIVMSLDTYLGRRGSLLETAPEAARLLHLPSPVLTDAEMDTLFDGPATGSTAVRLDATFDASAGPRALSDALDALCTAATEAVDSGHEIVVLSDRAVDATRAPIPMLLAVSTVHHHLIRDGRRMRASLVAEAGDARDVHHVATLIGFGASAVNPYLALASVQGLSGDDEEERRLATARYLRATELGLLKIMSKMGIAAVRSYHGAQIFEALGLGDAVIDRCFPGTTSRIGGIGLRGIAADVLERHRNAYGGEAMDGGGWYRYRRSGEYHTNEPPVWRALHDVAQGGGADAYRTYAELVHDRPKSALRDLLALTPDRQPIGLDTVESIADITRRFQTGAMSLGALSREAHEDVARAMNRLGGLSNTGEGGEDPRRYSPNGDLRDASSRVKQVASGRFGVTAGYLTSAIELEIKMAQGSKPGEGGQLPGRKVTPYIGTLRHVSPGTPLISPPPHHDIYSIEDIAQLISDLKMVNPEARVCVKLVSAEGVGTIAAGVAKAHADVIQISGADGGTGASPLSSLKYAGDPWELGLAETQQTLARNGLRGRVTLATDGGLHTGRDIVKAALLGAERYGFGTAALIALGCKMARQCHTDRCPVGIATQAEALRKKYFGTPEMLIDFFEQVAGEVREILAWLGYQRLDDVIGRADLLTQLPAGASDRWRDVDLSRLIAAPMEGPRRATGEGRARPEPPLDDRIVADAESAIANRAPFAGKYALRNTDRTVGGRVAGRIAKSWGDTGLAPGSIDLGFTGSAGQSFGAWCVSGMRLELVGEANDYVGKGMSGGEIAIRPFEDVPSGARTTSLVGNTVLYGATGGALFVAGGAGERFAVRNSGAVAVVEGVGKHGCEYMTGGVVAVLGHTGRNFGAGMSGGMAFVLDETGTLPARLHGDRVTATPVTGVRQEDLLHALVQRHYRQTGSALAARLLGNWRNALPTFWTVAPAERVGPVGERRPMRKRAGESEPGSSVGTPKVR